MNLVPNAIELSKIAPHIGHSAPNSSGGVARQANQKRNALHKNTKIFSELTVARAARQRQKNLEGQFA